MTEVKGFLAILSAAVFCPCHLPLLAALFAGTVVGTAIIENSGILLAVLGVFFLGALFLGVRWITRGDPSACATCEPGGLGPRAEERARDDSRANRSEPVEVRG